MSSDRRSRRPLLRVADWPGCVQVPWKAARAAGSALFRPDTPGRALSANSWRIAEEGFGKLLAMLKDQELLASCTGVGDIVTEPHLTAMAECMQADGLAINTQISYITGVALAARQLSPKSDWRWVQAGINGLRACVRKPSLVSQSHISSADLLLIGKRIFREARNDRAAPDMVRAVRARDGLMLALLSVRPLRRRTFAALQLGEHIQIDGDDVRIHVPATLMKGKKQHYFADWPATLKPELFCYIDTIRPILHAGAQVDNSSVGDALWVSERGSMLTADAIYRQVRHLTQQATGQAINLHRFRNIAARTVAINEPEQIDIAQEVLGHSDPRSKEFYIQADQLTAARRSHRVEDEILRIAAKNERS